MKGAVLLQPFGLAMLAVSLGVALAPRFGASWSEREPWLVLWGVLTYAATVSLSLFKRRTQSADVPAAQVSEPVASNLEHWTGEALRHLGSPAALSNCGLITAIPKTLARTRGDSETLEATTPIEQARLLRLILDAAIERLRLAEGAGSPHDIEALQYVILHEEYVLGRPNNYIMTHHSISETTFFRYRRQAIVALASDLAAQESLLASQQPSAR
jgi:hypothetical protein